MAGTSLMDSLFQRSLDDVIKGLRLSPPGTEATFIAKSLDEIRREIKSTDPQTKATALQKLTYLHSLHGADMSWAAFHAVELSSAAAHAHKRIAYLAASLSFNPSTTEVILLLTNQLRKDLAAPNVHDVSLALSTLCSICNPDLSRDLTPELFKLLSTSKFFVRKKAFAVTLKVFEQYPDAVRVCFKRVVENLDSTDMGVLSAVVGLFCELTVKEPSSCLPLSPEFYKILVDCRNNWILIKVLKIFAKLAPLEPRLGKRVLEPICKHLESTGAKSLVFECVRTIVTSFSDYESAVKLAVGKVREFLLEEDSNLKCLGLQALAVVAQKHMWAVLENKELVVKALSDADSNIKLEALRLVMSMVSEDNVKEICKILISHALKSDPEFCNEVLGFILLTCSRNFYEILYDFDWYVSFLGEMTRVPHCQKGREIESQLIDIGMRVKDARPELVQVARELVIDPALLGNPFVHEVLAAAAWISGEYVELSRNPFELMEALLQPRTGLLSPSIRSVYIHSAFKVLTFCIFSYVKLNADHTSCPTAFMQCSPEKDLQRNMENAMSESFSDTEQDNENGVIAGGHTSSRKHHLTKESIMGLINLVETNLGPLVGSDEVEIQERARNALGFIKLAKPKLLGSLDQIQEYEIKGKFNVLEVISVIHEVFSEELGPVSLNAQERVPVPDGLVLKENLSDLDAICGDARLPLSTSFSLVQSKLAEKNTASTSDSLMKEDTEPHTESTSLLAEHRKRHGLFYLPSEDKGKSSNDYPPARDPKDEEVNEDDDLAKLAEQSFVIKKKSNHVKPRPVVVRLDDGEGSHVQVKKSELKSDLLAGAVHEVLLGSETPSSSRSKSPRRSSKGRDIDGTSGTINDKAKSSRPESERRKHNKHGKGKKDTSPENRNKENDHRDKQKKDNHNRKHKSRHRADGSSNVAMQSSVIPDFLL